MSILPRSEPGLHKNSVRAVVFCFLAWPWLLLHRFAFWLDEWWFPEIGSQPIVRPLFVVGLPRSGTTLFHRLLASHSDTFTSLPLWELIFAPALCEKLAIRFFYQLDCRIGRPAGRIIDTFQRFALKSTSAIHATALQSPEEDYLGLLPFDGCFLRVLAYPFSANTWNLGFFSERMTAVQQQRFVKIYRGLLARHLVFRGDRQFILSKNPSFTAWLPPLATEFPDACFIGLRRAPCEAVPSQLSSIRDGMSLFGHDVCQQSVVDNFVALLAYYWKELDSAQSRWPQQRFQLVEYSTLIEQPQQTVTNCLRSFGYQMSDSDSERLRSACVQSSTYKSKHVYTLDEFGLKSSELNRIFGLQCDVGHDQTIDAIPEPVADSHTSVSIEAKCR